MLCYTQNSIVKDSLIINKSKLSLVSIAQLTAIGTSGVGLHSLWYSNNAPSKFHLFNDFGNWNNMDKIGHLYSSYQLSKVSYSLFKWSGMNQRKSTLAGSVTGLCFLSMIEIMDGFNSGWGFSISDMASNILGAGLFSSQQLIFEEQLFIPKFSYHPTRYALIRPEVLGKTHVERFFKDYNGQTYWLSFSPKSIFKNSRLPEWFCFSIGYSTDMKILGNSDYYMSSNETFIAKKEFLFSLDIDFQKIPCKNKFLKFILNQLNYLKMPFPTLIWQNNKLSFTPLYF